jgi:phenylpropionate dioxygenase-like ring-hydroxylating dioxygenase large terminal subunit
MALPGAKLKPGKLAHLMMLGEPIVVGRGRDGSVFALRDICPHRGIPLHYGRFDGETIECAYHAWRFDRSGTCVDVPSMTAEQKIDMSKIRCAPSRQWSERARLGLFPARRRKPTGETAEPRACRSSPRIRRTSMRPVFPCSIDHTTYGLMDPAHVVCPYLAGSAPRPGVTEDQGFQPKARLQDGTAQGAADADLLPILGIGVPDITYLLPGIHRGNSRRPPSGRRPDRADADHRRADHVPPDVLTTWLTRPLRPLVSKR